MISEIDTTFDFRSDTPPGLDPDSHSPTLRSYHQLLWSKPLPSGRMFNIEVSTSKFFLRCHSEAGNFGLTSDTVIPTFTRALKMRDVIAEVPSKDLDRFNEITYTIGGMIVFPGQKIGGKMTINGARGSHHLIKDRLDLTVECIRRHYLGEESPLSEVLERYADFFALFENFHGYVEFFLLQDIVSDDFSEVNYFLPFENFKTSPLPGNKDEYVSYMQLSIGFLEARNRRIRQYIEAAVSS